MALALPLLLGLAVAPLLGGRLSNLDRLRLKATSLLYLALALQLVAFPLHSGWWETPDSIAIPLWLASYGCLIIATLRNVKLPGVPVIGAGMAANLAAILANRGHMPALPGALRAAGLHYHTHYNSALDATPHLALLVDRFGAPAWVPLANVYSVGDILIAAGTILFAFGATGVPAARLFRRRPTSAEPSAAQRTTYSTSVTSATRSSANAT
jgi:hypothetical protein